MTFDRKASPAYTDENSDYEEDDYQERHVDQVQSPVQYQQVAPSQPNLSVTREMTLPNMVEEAYVDPGEQRYHKTVRLTELSLELFELKYPSVVLGSLEFLYYSLVLFASTFRKMSLKMSLN